MRAQGLSIAYWQQGAVAPAQQGLGQQPAANAAPGNTAPAAKIENTKSIINFFMTSFLICIVNSSSGTYKLFNFGKLASLGIVWFGWVDNAELVNRNGLVA